MTEEIFNKQIRNAGSPEHEVWIKIHKNKKEYQITITEGEDVRKTPWFKYYSSKFMWDIKLGADFDCSSYDVTGIIHNLKIPTLVAKQDTKHAKETKKTVITIPTQLQNLEFRFILLSKNLKSPYEKGERKYYKYNDDKILSHIANGYNYGVNGGDGNLRILDIDDKKLADEMLKKLNTFCVKTCGGTYHFYFITDYDTNHVFTDNKGEFRAKNYYVVCPNCYAIDTKKDHEGPYTVEKDIEIQKISKEEILKIIQPYIRENADSSESIVQPKDTSRSGLEYRRVISLLRERKSKEEIFKQMTAYSKWKDSPEQYREHTYNAALTFFKEEQKHKEQSKLQNFITVFTNKLDLARKFYDIQPFYFDSQKIWWLWDAEEYKWKMIDETDLLNEISQNSYANTISSKQKGEIIESLKQFGRLKKPLDPPKTWIQFKDTIIDIKTDKTFKASAKYFMTNPIPWELGQSEDTPTLDAIFLEWTKKGDCQDTSYVTTLHEILSYSLLPYMPIHRIICLIGDGLNGKGSFLRLVEKIVGKDNIVSSNLDMLVRNNFEISKLYKKLVVTIAEIDKDVFHKTALLKGITGDDLMRIEFKGKNSFDEHLYATPISACNILPETTDKTRGFFRRWTIVDFPNTFTEKKDILEDIPKEEYHNFCKKSIRLLKELLKKGEFTNDGSIEHREKRYETHSNPVDKFIMEYCTKDADENILFEDFYNRMKDFLQSQNYRLQSKIELSKSLDSRNFKKKIVRVKQEYGESFTTKMCIIGLKWNSAASF